MGKFKILNLIVYAVVFQKRSEYYKKRKEIFKRAEKYVKEYHSRERDEIRLARQARNRGNYYIPGEARLAFVIRIRG
jgi:hypothetical protein